MKSTRRQFIKNTAAVSIGAVAAPIILPSCSGYKGANDRLNVGHIGVGSRGSTEIKNYFLPQDGIRSVAVCDVKENKVVQAVEYINNFYSKEKGKKGLNCASSKDYKELLANKDIDAVHIVTLKGAYTLKGEGNSWPQDGLFDTVLSWDTNLEYDNGIKMRFLSADRAQLLVEKHRDYDATDGTTFFGEKGLFPK